MSPCNNINIPREDATQPQILSFHLQELQRFHLSSHFMSEMTLDYNYFQMTSCIQTWKCTYYQLHTNEKFSTRLEKFKLPAMYLIVVWWEKFKTFPIQTLIDRQQTERCYILCDTTYLKKSDRKLVLKQMNFDDKSAQLLKKHASDSDWIFATICNKW